MNKEIRLAYTQKRQTNSKYPQNKVNMAKKNVNNSKKNNNSKYSQTRMNISIKKFNSE